MPQLDFATPTGPVDWHYNISTPTLAFSPAIIPELPCVLFLHGSYGASGQDIFEPQFSDPRLREHLNLIGVDMRAFGGTRGAISREYYTPAVAADDVYRFMQALPLPPVHVFALSIGCCVALELAMAHPDVVLSLTLCSPLPLTEPEDVAAGRAEVLECWEKSLVHDGNPSTQTEAETSDPIMLDDVVFGYQQLVFNNHTNRMIDAQTRNALGLTKAGWGGSPELLEVARIVGHEWYVNRKPFPLESLAKINCPISLIHCADDVAYSIKHAQELQSRLREAGRTDVFLYQISGPHFGSVVNAQALNPILRDFVLSVEKQSPQPEPQPESEFRRNMVTPFTAMLARHGYDPFSDSDSESSLEILDSMDSDKH